MAAPAPRRRGLRAEVRLRPRQPSQRLGALTRQEQPVQLVAAGAPLGQAGETVIELLHVGLQRGWGAPLVRRTRAAARHAATVEAGMGLVGACYNFCWPHDS